MEFGKGRMEGLEIIVDKRFWKNKKVLITGYEGFLGSNLTRRLISAGSDVVGLDISVKRADTLLTKSDYGKMKVVRGDVADYKLLKKIIDDNGIQVVFHLAAEAIVGKCLEDPARAFSSNIKGTWSLLEACKHSPKIISVVVASSDKAYGSHKCLPYLEDAPLQGKHPYDVSKSCADLIAHTYYYTYGVPVAITRCGNIYGTGDFNFSRLLPDLFRSIFSGNSFDIRSDGKFTRDYIFVEDIVDGYILLAENIVRKELGGEAFNFSYEAPISVVDLVKKIYRLAGVKPDYTISNRAKYEIRHQYLSSAKARKVLGWKPAYTLDEGLKATMKWYRNRFGDKRKGDV